MNPRSLVITGAIGSGKSTVAVKMEDLGATRIDLDRLGHEVLATNEGAAFVAQHWPVAVAGSQVDRAKLGELVFLDPDQLSILEGFVHPRVRNLLIRQLGQVVGPTVVEASVPKVLGDWSGPVVVVDAPLAIRTERLYLRGMSEDDFTRRLRSQPDRAGWLRLADIVVSNVGSTVDLSRAARKLWHCWEAFASPPGSTVAPEAGPPVATTE